MKNRCRHSGRLITDVTEIVADLLSVAKQITAKVFEKIQKSRDLWIIFDSVCPRVLYD